MGAASPVPTKRSVLPRRMVPSRSELWGTQETTHNVCRKPGAELRVKLSSCPSSTALTTLQTFLSLPRTTGTIPLLRSRFFECLFIQTDVGGEYRRKWYHLKVINVLASARKTEVCKSRCTARSTVFRNNSKISLLFFPLSPQLITSLNFANGHLFKRA